MLQHLLGDLAAFRLQWLEPIGVGFLDVDAFLAERGGGHVYDQAYFDAYRRIANDPIGIALNEFRAGLLWDYLPEAECPGPEVATVLDVGVGDGAFLRMAGQILSLGQCKLLGADINPAAITYLEELGQLGSIEDGADVMCFWDSLEHFRDPRVPLRTCRKLALVSLPTFTSAEQAVTSKHFKPEEHFWYFTPWAFRQFADQEGFDVIDQRETETVLGREGISTFVLRRRPV
jgi:SAM-dependent methyltransferase